MRRWFSNKNGSSAPMLYLIGLGFCVSFLGLVSPAEQNGSMDAELPKKIENPTGKPVNGTLERTLNTRVQPFLERYCISCHGSKKPKADLDLSPQWTLSAITKNLSRWEEVLERLQAREMPPTNAPRKPTAEESAAVLAWIREVRDLEAKRNAGDPGVVLARRLSNAELDYTIRDLTGVDIRPAKEFPVDPANEAGFDNSGESLTMSPALFKKYLTEARLVADHLILKPEGLAFAPHPVVTETDRDKYCVGRIVAFYERHKVDLADYFQAALSYRFRVQEKDLSRFATDAGLSPKYLAQIWSILNDAEADTGPPAAVRELWRQLSEKGQGNEVRPGCEKLRDFVLKMRRELKPKVDKLQVQGISPGSQPLVLWNNRELAKQHRKYTGEVKADLRALAERVQGKDVGLAKFFAFEETDDQNENRLRGAFERFCAVFPNAFAVTDRGPYFDSRAAGKGRPLTAGFHLMQGYFRDDGPLCDLILDESRRREINGLWQELNFITLAPLRQYRDFIFFERAEPPRFMFDAEFDFARSEDKDSTSPEKMDRLAKAYLARAGLKGAGPEAQAAIEAYFTSMAKEIRKVEKGRIVAEPSQLDALVQFAERAYRRPLTKAERDDVINFYRKLRKQDDPGHEEALRDTLVTVLLSPHFCYRFDLAQEGPTVRPLSDHALASRLSYFLWSSMPDGELLAHAAAGNLHRPEVLKAQVRRMLCDTRIRRLATEFGGNWLDYRRFEEHNSVDRGRFPEFTNELRQAMFEEPIRFLTDVAHRNRSVLEMLDGKDTFVNRTLAKHYGMPMPWRSSPSSVEKTQRDAEEWVHVEDADRYGRGGLLPMAVFLTKNAPGLRTSPVKRGYWVVRRLLGEKIPPPPPTVPELPRDEASPGDLTLPQLLARHRDDKNCAGCHRRFDSVGLVFEGYGPVGERRDKDLGGRNVETSATFPDSQDRKGLAGLREYLREKRQDDFIDNLSRKLFSYALGRSLMTSDTQALQEIKAGLAANRYTFGSLVEAIVTTPQFLNMRGREDRVNR